MKPYSQALDALCSIISSFMGNYPNYDKCVIVSLKKSVLGLVRLMHFGKNMTKAWIIHNLALIFSP